MQAKKNAALLRRQGIAVRYERAAALKSHPVPTRFLLSDAAGLTPRMLAYNVDQLLCSTPMHTVALLFQALARWLGPGFVRAASKLYNALKGTGRSRVCLGTGGLL